MTVPGFPGFRSPWFPQTVNELVPEIERCLKAMGIVGAGGVTICVIGCAGAGPGYAACVGACFTTASVIVGACGGVCLTAAVLESTAIVAGCGIGCWWD